ncbi:MAG: choice-of-anchor H family protein, partial [Candidatus Marinimicrobia bacterium]|nr:choice-of-anchor H family protein [Candidatus Neomarinimicrobiota bacterium]
RIAYKPYLSSTYATYYITGDFTITGYESGDAFWVAMGSPNQELAHGIYDFKIEIYDANTDQVLVTHGPENDGDLDNISIETAAEDGSSSETYSVYNAWWTDAVDNDGDEYPWYRKLNMDIDCSSGTHNIYVKVLYKYATSSTWTEYFETGVFAITEYQTGDAIWVAIGSPNTELSHTLYDFKIEVYKEGGSSSVASLDPSGDADLNDMASETAVEDGANDRTYSVYDAWWGDQVDGDSDGYTSYRKLYFDVDVSSGSWPVYVRVSYKTASASTYSTYFTTSRYMITGYNSSDAQWVAVGLPNTQLPHNSYDFKLEVFVSGTSSAKASTDAADDASLDNQSFEMASED